MQVQPSLITPAEPFDVFYFLRNPVDTATYYIKAVIYDVRTGQLITFVTLNQSSVNAHLFIATLQAPPDPVGIGRNIVAIASVYTDSGYTTKSDAYEEQESYFLVKAQLPFLGGGGGVDYGIVREIVGDELDKRKPKELPPPPPLPFDAVFGALGTLQREINRIPKEHPETTPVDRAPIATKLDAIAATVRTLHEAKKLDTAPLSAAIEDTKLLLEDLRSLPHETVAAFDQLSAELQGTLKAMETRLEASLTDVIESQEITIPVSRSTRASRQPATVASTPPATPIPPEPLDVSHLMKQ